MNYLTSSSQMKLGNAQIVKLRFPADPINYIAQATVGRELRKRKETLTTVLPNVEKTLSSLRGH